MLPGQVMRVSLAMEEMMTLILSVNQGTGVEFDLRVYSLDGVIGIRIRYSGREFNPLCHTTTPMEKLIYACRHKPDEQRKDFTCK